VIIYTLKYDVLSSSKRFFTPLVYMKSCQLYTCMAPKLKCNNNTINSFVSMGKIIRPKHINCYLWSNFHLTLKNIFDKKPDINLQQATRHMFTNCNRSWWCSWVSCRVFGKSNRDLEYVIFLNSCDVKIRHNLIIRTYMQNRVVVRLYITRSKRLDTRKRNTSWIVCNCQLTIVTDLIRNIFKAYDFLALLTWVLTKF
jgi:hypothetical protein